MTKGFPIDLQFGTDLPPELDAATARILSAAITSACPTLVTFLGGPGSGKTLFMDALPLPGFARLRFDDLMQVIDAYRAETDPIKAHRDHESAARLAGYRLLSQLLNVRTNILFEHSNARLDHVDLLNHAKSLGYRIVMIHMMTDNDVAKARIKAREAIIGRHVPESYIDERAAITLQLLPDYKALADVYIPVDNNGDKVDFGKAVHMVEKWCC